MTSTMPAIDPAVPQHVLDLAAAQVVSDQAVTKTALRHERREAEHLVVALASHGRLGLHDVVALAAQVGRGEKPTSDALAPLSPAGVSALAFLTIGRALDDESVQRTADLFSLARTLARRDGVPTEHPWLDLQVHLAAGRLDAVRSGLLTDPRVDGWIRWAAEADLANPFADPTPEGLGAWYAVFDRPFVERGIDPVRIADSSRPFETLTTAADGGSAGSVDGPLVSIVVPVYATGTEVLTAVRSLLRQTWRNLEIIVVDDASPAEHRHVFNEVLDLDDRVEVIRMPVNGGAYRARNAGIARATGEVVGIQDADDWSHPERIARQMAVMAADPALVATLSRAVRLHSDLLVTKVGSLPFERNLPSLLFRREEVLGRLGEFDDVRKAADTEFVERIAATFGPGAVRTLEEPLALYQLTHGSLSREDFRIGWHRHTRVSYHGGYRHWHRSILAGVSSPHLERRDERPFPAPPEIEGVPYPSTTPDVVVLADVRSTALVTGDHAAELTALSAAGLAVGLARAEPMRLGAVNRAYPSEAVAAAVAAGHASWAPLVAELTPELLLVRDPDLLAFPPPPETVGTRPARVVVVADRLPSPEGRRRISYDPVSIEAVVRELFGRPTEWWPATADVAAALRTAGATGHLHDPTLPDVVTTTRTPHRPHPGAPVLGVPDFSRFLAERVSRHDLASIPTDGSYDVRLLDHAARTHDDGRLSFTLADVTPVELYDQCDIVIGLPPAVGGVDLRYPLLQAMGRGCVVVAHPTYHPVLGDAALYYGERTVVQVVDDLWDDPAAYAAQQQRGLMFCQDALSAEAFATAVARIRSTDPAL